MSNDRYAKSDMMKLTSLLNLVENCMFHLIVNYKFRLLERKIVKKNFA